MWTSARPFRFRINSCFASRASAFSAATETLTVEQDLRPAEPGIAYGFPTLAAFGQTVAVPPWSAIARDSDAAASPDAGSAPSRNVVSVGRPTDWPSPLAPPGSLPIDLPSVPEGDVSGPEDGVGSAISVSQEAVPIVPIVAPSPLVGSSGLLPPAGNDTVSTTSTTTSLAQPPACMHGTTSTTTTSPGALPLPPAVTVAFSVPGDQPRCVRLGPGEHVADVLWQILQDPWRVLPEGRAWTLVACPRSFPDRLAGRLVLTTVASINANQCCVWADVRSEPPRLFTVMLDFDSTRDEILWRFGRGAPGLLLLLDGAIAGSSPALRDGCVLTVCQRKDECLTEPLPRLFSGHPTLRLLQLQLRLPTCILDLARARRAASFYAVPIAVSLFRREFLFRLAAEAQTRQEVVCLEPHQAPLALCSPAFGVCHTTAGFRVAPTSHQLRPFLRDAWPCLAQHLIADTGEFFGDSTFFTLTHPSCPLVAWLRAGAEAEDVLFLPVDVHPLEGIPCPAGLHPHVFRHEGS